MTLKKLLIFCFVLLCQVICAQQDSIAIKEVIVSDYQLKHFSDTQSVRVFNDSTIRKSQPSLTSLLNYNSAIYFKENGLGMVSSPSFRGTTAQQTAVIWNGININSQLLGQTDFNTISARDFSSVTVRAGGGSAIYGSSAIGGSIHLNNDLDFSNHFYNNLQLDYGSFNTFNGDYQLLAANETATADLGISRNSSDNDYDFSGAKGKKNENGQYYNTSFNAAFGYKIDRSNFLKFYSQFFDSERHFSSTISAPSKSKYRNSDSRNLLEWNSYHSKFISTLKIAALGEQYKYFENAAKPTFESAKADTWIAKYDIDLKFGKNIDLNTIADYTQTQGIGANIGNNTRKIASGTLLFKHRIFQKLEYEFNLRKEITDDYKSPLLYGFGTKWQAAKNYSVKLDASRNFRIPTFNDLYWQGSGNPDLKPESAYQAEIGQQLDLHNFTVSATVYYIKIEDLLRWKPKGNDWAPENVSNVTCYGTEIFVDYNRRFGRHSIAFHSVCAYTVSQDDDTKLQLTYVPFYKATAGLAYSFKKATLSCQYLYNGQVYLLTDHSRTLDGYQVSNIEIHYDFGKLRHCEVGFEVRNVLDENYESVSKRPMPGRNYAINIILKY